MKTSFMPNNIVFPGGAVEKTDSNKNWSTWYKKFNINENCFKNLTIVQEKNRPVIFQTPYENNELGR